MATADLPATASLRERKKKATRTALRRAAVALVAARGTAAVTIEDIAAAADVSPRTFFNYFPSKEDAIIGWDPGILAEMTRVLRERPAGEPAPLALREMFVEVLGAVDADRADLLARLQVIRADPQLIAHHVARWSETERQLVAALAERRGSDPGADHYAALVVAVTMAAARAALMSWSAREGQAPLVTVLAAHLEVVATGLAEPAGVLA